MKLPRLFKKKHIPVTVIYPPNIGISEELQKELRDDTARIFRKRFGAQRRRQFMSFESLPPTLKKKEGSAWLLDEPCKKHWWQRRRKR